MIGPVAEFFLFFNKTLPHALILMAGLCFLNRAVFFQLWTGYLLAGIYSKFLQLFFAVPLMGDSVSGKFGFPSGHTLISVVFYGYLFVRYSFWGMRLLLFTIMAGLSYAVFFFNYHTPEDVYGGIGFGVVFVFTLHQLFKAWPLLTLQPFLLMRFLVAGGGISLVLLSAFNYLRLGIWETFWTMCALWISSELFPDWLKTKPSLKKQVMIFISLILLTVSFLFLFNAYFSDFPVFIKGMKYIVPVFLTPWLFSWVSARPVHE